MKRRNAVKELAAKKLPPPPQEPSSEEEEEKDLEEMELEEDFDEDMEGMQFADEDEDIDLDDEEEDEEEEEEEEPESEDEPEVPPATTKSTPKQANKEEAKAATNAQSSAKTTQPQVQHADEDEEDDREEGEQKSSRQVTATSVNVIVNEDGKDAERIPTFAELGLCPVLCEAVKSMGWKEPSIIQRETLPIAFRNRDIIGLAETGSGKTGAFALPILQALLVKPQPLFALVLAPTRELAIQISDQFQALGSSIHLKTATIVGGVDEMDQARALARMPHVIVATPGRIVYHIENTKGFSLRNLKFLVLDEADRLLNMDFEKEIDRLLEVIPRDRRTFLFSATMTSKVAKLQRASLINPVKVEVSKKYQTAKNLVQQYVFCAAKYKDVYLTYILNELAGNTAIIFTATCEHAQRVALLLRNLGFAAIPLHGKMTQAQRVGALNKFKDGQRNILLATDVASRGLDIPAVDLVINYDVPTHSKDYIHRVGRTARAGRSGRAITVVTQYDVELYQRIENLLDKKLPEYPVLKEAALILSERVAEAQRLAILELREQEAQEERRLKNKKKGGRKSGDA